MRITNISIQLIHLVHIKYMATTYKPHYFISNLNLYLTIKNKNIFLETKFIIYSIKKRLCFLLKSTYSLKSIEYFTR